MIKKVVVLTGGDSPERPVSIRSSESVMKALGELGLTGVRVLAEGDFIPRLKEESPDAVFIAMHGGRGENGSVQGMLEVLGIPYTGSGVLASSLCMDKSASKKVFSFHGLPVPAWQEPRSSAELEMDLPVVIKPVCGGSTIGTTIVREPSALEEAFRAASEQGGRVMAEEYIPGREVTVGILEDKPLPVLEIEPNSEFYDYSAKYSRGGSRHFPLEDGKLCRKLQEVALEAFRAARCSSFGRVDFRVDGDKFYILEINTIPGMTSTSLLPEAAGYAGISFIRMVSAILNGAGYEKY